MIEYKNVFTKSKAQFIICLAHLSYYIMIFFVFVYVCNTDVVWMCLYIIIMVLLLSQRTTHGLDDSGDNRHSRKKHSRSGSGEGVCVCVCVCVCVYAAHVDALMFLYLY